MTRSKRSGAYLASASLPPPAVSTEWPSWISISFTASQTNGSSSTTRIRRAGVFVSASDIYCISYRLFGTILKLKRQLDGRLESVSLVLVLEDQARNRGRGRGRRRERNDQFA